MIIRHVQFPCGRRGLELETWAAAVNGCDGDAYYSYAYNGQDYVFVAKNENVPLEFYSGKLQGLKVLRTLRPFDVLMAASSDWM